MTYNPISTTSSGKNYISNGDAEFGLTGWTTSQYTNGGGGGYPVGGFSFGTYSGNSTWTRSTTSPLRGSASFLYTKSAASAYGDIQYYQLTIDPADKGKVLSYSFDYTVASGTYADGDVVIAIFDNTNATWTQPSGYKINSVGVGTTATATGTFQVASNASILYFGVFVLSTSTAAYSLKFDNFSLGPQVVVNGLAGSDDVQYTPVITGFGTPTGVSIFSRRVGPFLHVHGRFTSGTTTAVEGRISLGYNGSNGNVTTPATISTIENVGRATTSVTGAVGWSMLCEPSVGYLTFGQEAASNAGLTKKVANTLLSSGDTISFYAMVPILGWSSNVISSDSAATRSIVFKGTNAAGTSVANTGDTAIPFTSAKDTHGAWVTDTYTVKVPGDYLISATNYFTTATYAALSAVYGTVYKNGTAVSSGKVEQTQIATYQVGVETKVLLENCVAGDTIQFKLANGRTAGATTLASSGQFNHIEIMQIQGPAQIQAATIVAVDADSPTSVHSASASDMTGWTTRLDTSGSFNATTGVFTAPGPGVYQIDGAYAPNNTATPCSITIFKNGSAYNGRRGQAYSAGTVFPVAQVHAILNLISGDTLKLQAGNSSGSNITTDGTSSSVQIRRLNGVN